MVYPRIPVQRCWAHKVRNILDGIRVPDRPEAKRTLGRIYEASSRYRAVEHVLRFGARWEAIYPKAVRQLTKNLEELLAFFTFDDPDWRRRARTTNAIERRFREVRRRTRPMGVFSDRTSIERILYAVFRINIGQEEDYLLQQFGNDYRRYAEEVPRLFPRFSRPGRI